MNPILGRGYLLLGRQNCVLYFDYNIKIVHNSVLWVFRMLRTLAQSSTLIQNTNILVFSGYYQPAGPVIGSASPGSNAPPPTATVQPTVVSSTSSTLSFNRGSSTVEQQSHRRDEYSRVHHVKESPRGESPMKAPSAAQMFQHHQQQQQQHQQQQQQPPGFIQHPSLPGGFTYASPYAAYAHPYPTSADIYRAAVPPPGTCFLHFFLIFKNNHFIFFVKIIIIKALNFIYCCPSFFVGFTYFPGK
jgi:hypothetical protein